GTPDEIASDEVIRVSSSKWRFTFAAGTLASKDSVNLLAGSGLVDLVDNSPADYNKYRPIKKIGTTEPRWGIGYIKDTKGDGWGDEITVTIIPGSSANADKPGDVKKYEYSWPVKDNFMEAPVTTLTITGNSLTAADNSITDGAGAGNARLEFPSATIKGDIIDSVWPACIDSAILLDKQNVGDPDMLIVTFSEPIKENLLTNTKYLKIDNIPKISLNASKNSGETEWLFTFPANTVAAGDSVNLVSGSSDLPV
ncbi:MAG: hypothetical protein GY869_16385, partial [Planctomycetes bacterium]|nr:hypothetical protein [Planctomycetota bacterium]